MKNKGKALALILSLILLLCACNAKTGDTESTSDEVPTAEPNGVYAEDTDAFTSRDYEVGYDESDGVLIELNGDSISCTSSAVQISGTTATITGDGTYILSGTLTNGRIVVNADKKAKPQLVLNGVSIHCATSAPLYILQADKVFVTLGKGTANTLSNGGTFTAVDANNIDAALFSKEDLTLNGEGSLTVTSPAGHGIVCKDDLVITSGTYSIDAASHAIDANDSVSIKGSTLKLTAGKDGIHAENSDDADLGYVYLASGTFNINAQGDGVSASGYLQIKDGTFSVTAGGGSSNATKQHESNDPRGGGGFFGIFGRSNDSSSTTTTEDSTSCKGFKSTGSLQIKGGTFTIDSADDAVHSNTSITVDGGTFQIATGDDGFHADETLTVTGGTINITESYEGLEALHLDIRGGNITLVATDDGLNAAGGNDSSGFDGPRGGDRFGRGGAGGSSSNGTIVISGGTIYIKASGDGIDANGTLEITGGNITVCGPTQGDTATLDFDVSGTISGGTFIGTGAAGMAQTFSASEQGVISVTVGNQSAGTQITLTDKSGKTLVSHAPELPFAVVILSTPDLVKGETYTLTVGTSTKEFQAS